MRIVFNTLFCLLWFNNGFFRFFFFLRFATWDTKIVCSHLAFIRLVQMSPFSSFAVEFRWKWKSLENLASNFHDVSQAKFLLSMISLSNSLYLSFSLSLSLSFSLSYAHVFDFRMFRYFIVCSWPNALWIQRISIHFFSSKLE